MTSVCTLVEVGLRQCTILIVCCELGIEFVVGKET